MGVHQTKKLDTTNNLIRFETSSSRFPISEFPSLAAEHGGRCDNGLQPEGESHTPILPLPNI